MYKRSKPSSWSLPKPGYVTATSQWAWLAFACVGRGCRRCRRLCFICAAWACRIVISAMPEPLGAARARHGCRSVWLGGQTQAACTCRADVRLIDRWRPPSRPVPRQWTPTMRLDPPRLYRRFLRVAERFRDSCETTDFASSHHHTADAGSSCIPAFSVVVRGCRRGPARANLVGFLNSTRRPCDKMLRARWHGCSLPTAPFAKAMRPKQRSDLMQWLQWY